MEMEYPLVNLGAPFEDDGNGFDVETSVKGIGLKNMKSRVKNLHGKISFKSSQEGTIISIEIPINQNRKIWLSA